MDDTLDEGEEATGEMGEEDVEETVHVESADAGRRAVWIRCETEEARETDNRTYVHTDVRGLGQFAGPGDGVDRLANDEAAGVNRDLHAGDGLRTGGRTAGGREEEECRL